MDVVEQIDRVLDRATQDFDGRDEIMARARDELTHLRNLIRENWHGNFWRGVTWQQANEVRAALGMKALS